MQTVMYLQVSERQKYVDFSTLYPELLANRYYEYILYHKQRKSKTESFFRDDYALYPRN